MRENIEIAIVNKKQDGNLDDDFVYFLVTDMIVCGDQ